MYQINSRFFLGLLAVVAVSSLSLLSGNVITAAILILISVTFYLTIYFMSLKMLNDMQREREHFYEQHKGQEYVELSSKEFKQMKAEGAFEKDGKFMIDEDYEVWKKTQEAIKVSAQLQSLQEKN